MDSLSLSLSPITILLYIQTSVLLLLLNDDYYAHKYASHIR